MNTDDYELLPGTEIKHPLSTRQWKRLELGYLGKHLKASFVQGTNTVTVEKRWQSGAPQAHQP